jgi:cell division protein FtsA
MKDIHINKNEIAVALDIGTTKICAIAGRLNEYGKIEVLGLGTVKSEGVSRGVVINIDKTVRSIREAVEIAERNAGCKFKVVHVGIAGQHIKSLHHHGLLTRDNAQDEIKESDVKRLIRDMHKLVLPPGVKILHVIPQEFTVDDERDIMDPVGMAGIRLEANFHIITGQITASRNIMKCVEKGGLEVADMTLEPIASSAAVVTEEEKEAGVVLVDIGGGTTDVTVFKDGIIRHTGVIPFGGHVITKDIQAGCSVLINQAEKLKVKFGSALSDEIFDNRIITIPGINGREPSEISEKNLARIIQARVEEIFDQVMFEIKRSGYEDKLLAGVILTGGGSMLRHIELLSNYHTGMHTRIGRPVEHLAHGYTKQLASPIYATAVGLLKTSIENMDRSYVEIEEVEEVDTVTHQDVVRMEEEGKWYNKIYAITRDFFDPKPDSDF